MLYTGSHFQLMLDGNDSLLRHAAVAHDRVLAATFLTVKFGSRNHEAGDTDQNSARPAILPDEYKCGRSDAAGLPCWHSHGLAAEVNPLAALSRLRFGAAQYAVDGQVLFDSQSLSATCEK